MPFADTSSEASAVNDDLIQTVSGVDTVSSFLMEPAEAFAFHFFSGIDRTLWNSQ
jgi:hypothetical protein